MTLIFPATVDSQTSVIRAYASNRFPPPSCHLDVVTTCPNHQHLHILITQPKYMFFNVRDAEETRAMEKRLPISLQGVQYLV
jgi:hypothetical protein